MLLGLEEGKKLSQFFFFITLLARQSSYALVS